MNFRSAFTLVVAVLIGLFALINWRTVSTPTSIDFLVASFQAPLGIIFLLILGTVVLVYLLLGALAETRSLRESRESAKELDRLRRLVDNSEASQIAELRGDVTRELAQIKEKLDRILAQRSATAGSDRGDGRSHET